MYHIAVHRALLQIPIGQSSLLGYQQPALVISRRIAARFLVTYRDDVPLKNRQLATSYRDQAGDQRVHRHIVKASDYDSDSLMRGGDLERRRSRNVIRIPSLHRQLTRTTGHQVGDGCDAPAEHSCGAEALIGCMMEQAFPRVVHEEIVMRLVIECGAAG